MSRISRATMVALLLGLSGVPAALAEPDEGYGDDYQAGNYGRVRYEESGPTLVRASSEGQAGYDEQATANAPVFPGDSLRTDPRQRAEVQLASGTVLRVDRSTELGFQALPDPYAEYPDNAVLKLSWGTLQISAELRESEEFRIDTPDASVYLMGGGDFRIEVIERRETRVSSRRGVAEVVGDGGSVLIRGGTWTAVSAGSIPEDPRSFNTFVADDFDRWVGARVQAFAGRAERSWDDGAGEVYQELPYEVRPYYGELSRHGRWVYVSPYGYCWYPFDVAAGWRPYYDGYWSYGPGGYFWVSSEPWGWAPYHYGRWTWAVGYGWCWVPGRVFAGAWVSWAWGSAWVGWAPLNYWNHPVWIHDAHYGYYDPSCWTFVGHDRLHHGHYGKHAIPVSRVREELGRTAIVTRPPRVSPRELAEDEGARTRAAAEARGNPRVAVPAPGNSRSRTAFTDVERTMVGGRGRASATREVRGAPRPVEAEGAPVPRATRGAAPRVRAEDRGSTPGATRGLATPNPSGSRPIAVPRPRQLVTPSEPSARPSSRRTGTGGEPDRAEPPARERETRAAPSRTPAARERSAAPAAPRDTASPDTDARLRSLYRKMAEPRTTAPREQPGSRPDARKASPPQRRETAPAAPPRSDKASAPQRRETAPAAPSRSDKASPSKSRGSSSTERSSGRGDSKGGGQAKERGGGGAKKTR